MGNSNHTINEQLEFIEQLQDKHFGLTDIYRNNEGRFIMKLKRTHIVGDPRQTQFQKIVEWVLKLDDSMVVPIIHIDSNQEKGMCIQYEVTQIYTEYYNYTLKDLSEHKKELIEQSELWCVLEGLLQLTTTLRKNKFAAALSIDNVFLTLNGTPCVYLYHLLSLEESISYNEHGMGQMIARILLQLASGQKIEQSERQQQSKQLMGLLSKVCSRFKWLGRIIKELLNRQKTQEEALAQIASLIEANKIKKAPGVKINRFKYLLPENLQMVPQHNQRISQADSANIRTIKKSNSLREAQNTNVESSKNGYSVQRKSKQSTEKKGALIEQSSNKQNELLFSKQDATKLLTDLSRKKEENRVQMQRLLMKKLELMNHDHRQNKQNSSITAAPKPPNKKNSREERSRRVTEISQGSRRR